MTDKTTKLTIAALVGAQVLFGIHYAASKALLTELDPIVWASIRSVCTAVVFVVVCAMMGKLDPKKALKNFAPLFVFSLLSTSFNQMLFLTGLRHTTPVNSALLNTLLPIMTLFFVASFGKERITTKQGVGFVTALLGVLVLMHFERFDFSSETLFGDVLTILNVACYSLFLTFSRPFIMKHDGIWVTTWLFVYGSCAITVLSLPAWTHVQMPAWTPTLIACAVYGILGGTVFAYFLTNYALARTKSSQVALFVYIQPIVASIIGWVWFGQQPTGRTLIAGLLVFTGVGLAVTSAKHVRAAVGRVTRSKKKKAA
jgi:drug/metabolite transporter (DMT)-like permease